jgi:nucleoside-triphosphatase THEP1
MKFQAAEKKAIKSASTSFLSVPPLKEAHDKHVPGLNFQITENGARILIAGRPGSGKSVLVQNLFRENGPLYQKFDNCYLIIPHNSLLSVEKHPFEGHERVYHTIDSLGKVMEELQEKKEAYFQYKKYQKELASWKQRQKTRKRKKGEEEEDTNDPPPGEVEPAKLEYSVLIIDDFGPQLKDTEVDKLLKKFFSRSRHFMCQVYVVCQDYLQMSMTCRKLLSHCILFSPSNRAWERFTEEQLLQDKAQAQKLRRYAFDAPYNTLMVDEEKHLYKNFEKIDEAALGLD